jgi:adenylate cyclase
MFFYYSFDDLINGKISKNSLKNRVVLLGPYAVGLADDYITSIDRGEKMFGVEIQANILNALLREDFSVEVSELPQSVTLFLITFVLICVLFRRKLWLSSLISLAAAALWVGLCVALRQSFGVVLHPLYVPAAIIMTFVGTLAHNYFTAAKERRKVTDTFKKYVAPEIVTEILKSGADLTHSRTVDLAVLFVDIRGFTAMSEALQNEFGDGASARVVEVLNRYLTLTSSCVKKNGGTLDKFIGDATMAFWGAPFPREDYIYLAVKAGMDMIAGAGEIEEVFGKRVGFGIGVHSGKAVVGNVGASDRMDYTAIGDTINTAARLEANAPAGELWVSKTVADALKDKLSVTSLGVMKFKNKSEFEVFRADELK